MTLDSRFVSISDLQSLFVDKTTGLPLTNGYVLFFRDSARDETKDVYILSGSPGNYTYTNIGNQIDLGAAGSPVYGIPGADITIFYFPFDGTPDNSNNEIDLYYVEIYSESETLQFTRQAVPYYTANSSGSSEELINYIPNGQFLSHTDLPAQSPYIAGQIREDTTFIAQGGWTFERNAGSTATDIVTFIPYNSYVSNPTGSPKYKMRVQTTTVGTNNTRKDICIKFNDVNKFASTEQYYTFSVTAKQTTGGIAEIDVFVRKYFGAGGSTTEETQIGTFSINSIESIKQVRFVFGTNQDFTIGSGNDSYVQLVMRLPLSTTNDMEFVDAILTPNQVDITKFPYQTEADCITNSIPGWLPVPNPDGSDLYLLPRLTKAGMIWDNSEIGNIIADSNINSYTSGISTISNNLIANGNSFLIAGYSSLGIPYRRLYNKFVTAGLVDSTTGICRFGNGSAYLTAYLADISPATTLRIPTNSASSVTNAANGATSTTFTISTIAKKSDALGYQVSSHIIGASQLSVINNSVGAVTAVADGGLATGFTFVTLLNKASVRQVFTISTVAASAMTAGHYFIFSSTTTNYYVWYTINTAGSDPAVGGRTGIKIDLLSTDTATEVARKTREALNGFQITEVVCAAASAVPAGSWFTINTTTINYYVWYKKDGAGTDPAVVNATGILVNIVAADTAAQVASKTQLAINNLYYQIPDLRGVVIRGFDNTNVWDLDAGTRWTNVSSSYGAVIGSLEYFKIESHVHPPLVGIEFWVENQPFGNGGAPDGNSLSAPATTGAYGGSETRMINAAYLYAIKY